MDALATELQKPEYASLSDQAAADLINAKIISKRELVPTWLVKQHGIENGYFAAIKIASCDTTIPVEVRGLCISVLAWIDDQAGKIQSLDMDLASTQTMVGGLIASGILTQAQATSLDQLADHEVRWVDQVGLGTLGGNAIAKQRERINLGIA
jgi:hypothetical protein